MKEQVDLEELYRAYYDCRKKKRNKLASLDFEMHYESEMHRLWEELNLRTYKISKSICFCVTRPKLREVFAASFRDRVAHHYLINRIGGLIDDEMIEDSYNCRKGKGTDYGVGRIAEKIRVLSNDYTKECWLLKCDIKGFFMSIDKERLHNMVDGLICEKYRGEDAETVRWLARMIILHRPEQLCEIRGSRALFDKLPDDKTLFRNGGKGMPIGNLTSQIFGNYYLTRFDKWMAGKLGEGYGRYVDDFVCIHPSKKYLLSLIGEIRDFLRNELELTLHPTKVYLQEVTKGVKFIGSVIKPGRVYVGNRTINNAFEALEALKGMSDVVALMQKTNCYAGFMVNDKSSYHLRHKLLEKAWRMSERKAYADRRWRKLVIKKQYKPKELVREKTENERYSNNPSRLQAIRAQRRARSRMARHK